MPPVGRFGYNRSDKPLRPRLNRGQGLACGLTFAFAAFDEGATDTDFASGLESVGHVAGATRHRGTWNIDPFANGVRWETYGYGLSFDEGPALPNKRLIWADPGGINNPIRGLTVYCAIRKEGAQVVPPPGDNFVFGKRDDVTGAFPGYALLAGNIGARPGGPGWNFEICSAAGVQAAAQNFLGNDTQTVNEDTVLVGRYDLNNVELWQDGELVGSNAAAFNIGASTNPVSMFNVLAGGLQIDAAVMAAGIWNRELSPGEIGQLFADPFTLWRQPHREFFLGVGPGLAAALRNGCCCPC